jgi:peptide/nickel transport system permease protein
LVSYIIRRLLIAIPTLIGVATISFLLLHLIPGDPARVIAGPQAPQAQVNHLREQLGLNLPLWQQYLTFLWGLAHGNLGTSFVTGGPVLDQISSRFPYTLALAVLSMLLALVIGISLGVLAALRQNSVLDLFISALAVFGVSMPVFWTGLLLIILFAVDLHLLPAAGAETPQSYILPAFTLAFFSAGFIARQTRGAMLDVMGLDYVRTARAKGAGRQSVLIRHGLRNALLPITTAVGLQFGALLGGAVLTETIYSWPGMGQYLVNSVNSRDYVAVQGTIFVFAVAVILVNLITDLVYAYIDPRIRYD